MTTRDDSGKFIPSPTPIIAVKNVKTSSTSIPPLVDLKVSNPVTYLKLWWKRILANEGVTITFRVKPLTTLAIVIMLSGGSLLLTNYIQFRTRFLDPFFPELNITTVDTGFSGTLYSDGEHFFLTQPDSQAITTRSDSKEIDLATYIALKVFIAGKYDPYARTITISTPPQIEHE